MLYDNSKIQVMKLCAAQLFTNLNHFLLLLFCITYTSSWSQDPFIITIKTDNPGSTNDSSISFYSSLAANYDVDWDNDGIFDEFNLSGTHTHDFGAPGIYTIQIRGLLHTWRIPSTDTKKLVSLDQWGDVNWSLTMNSLFYDASNMAYNAVDAPNVSNVISMSGMFYNCSITTPDLSAWDVSSVTNFNLMFAEADQFNSDISMWNTSSGESFLGTFKGAKMFNQDLSAWYMQNATTLEQMFNNADAFNGNISTWDVSQVQNFSSMFFRAISFAGDISMWNTSSSSNFSRMFFGATNFNADISMWDVSNGTLFNEMFRNATSFNQNLSGWDVSQGQDFEAMFMNAEVFNQDLSNWIVSSGTDFSFMFDEATVFNSNLNSWDVSNATTMKRMFRFAEKFNYDLSSWDVSNVTNFNRMFRFADDFNQDLSAWDISSGTDFEFMFDSAGNFNQNLSTWNFSSAIDLTGFLSYSGMDISNYDALLHSLAGQMVNSNLEFGAVNLEYCESQDDRQYLINNKMWTFVGDSYTTNCQTNGVFDLALRTTVNPSFPGPYYETALVDFDITVFNQGDIDAYNVGIKGFFLAGLSLADPDWTNNTLDNPIPFIAAGDSATVQITLQVVLNSAGFFVRYDAEIISADDDTDPSNTPPTDIDSTPGDYSAQTPFAEDDNIHNTTGLDDQDLGGFTVSVGTAEICDNGIDDDGDGDIDCEDSNCQSICIYECWDLNQNGVPDEPEEDINGDGVVNDNDCPPDCSNMEAFCQDATIYLGENGVDTLDAAAVFAGITPGCIPTGGTISQSIFTCDHLGDNLVTVTAFDNLGNSASCVATVTVLDTITPELICTDLVVELDNTELVNIDINDILIGAGDNCGLDTIILAQSQFTCQDITGMVDFGYTIEEDTFFNTSNNFINEILVRDDLIYLTIRPSDEILIYDLQGNFQTSFGVSGNGIGEFGEPESIAFAANGDIYVSDRSWNEKILVFDSTYNFQFEFSTPAVEDIAIQNDTIYAAHDNDNKISMYSLNGSFIGDLISFNTPTSLYLKNNKIYVVSTISNAVAGVYTMTGSLLNTINIGGWANDISADDCGNIYIARWNDSSHDIYNQNGNLILNSNISLLSMTTVDDFVYGVTITGGIHSFQIDCGTSIGAGTFINSVTLFDDSGNESVCNSIITIIDPGNTCICPIHLRVDDNPIPSQVYRSEKSLNSYGRITSPEIVNFESLKISLEQGFKVEQGATFKALINPCID